MSNPALALCANGTKDHSKALEKLKSIDSTLRALAVLADLIAKEGGTECPDVHLFLAAQIDDASGTLSEALEELQAA